MDEFAEEFWAVFEVVSGVISFRNEVIAEAPEGGCGVMMSVGVIRQKSGLAEEVTNTEAADGVGVVFIEPIMEEFVETQAMEKLVDFEILLLDFDGAIVVKGHVHTKTFFR